MWKAEVNLGCHSDFWILLSQDSLIQLGCLASKSQTPACLCSSQSWYHRLVSSYHLVTWVLGISPRVSCMQSMHFIDGAISPALQIAFWKHVMLSLSLRSYSSKQSGEEDFPGPPCSSLTGQCSGGAPPSSFMLLEGSPVRWCRLATSVSITPGDGSVEASTVQSCSW